MLKLATRLAALERLPQSPGAPLVLYPLAGESPEETLARAGYAPDTVHDRPLLLVVYADPPEEL